MLRSLLLLLFCSLVFSTNAQNRKYLIYSDENVARLEKQIKKDKAVKKNWNNQYQKAENLLEKEKIKPADCQLLGLAYRVTGEARFAEKVKTLLFKYAAKDTWEGKTLLNRNPVWQAGLGTSHTSYYIAIAYDSIYEFLAQKEREELAQRIVDLGITPAREDWLNPENNMHTFDTMGHNWWSACVFMSGFSSLAVRDEIPEATGWAKETEGYTEEWMTFTGSVLQNKPPTFDKDGGFYESINYAEYAMSQYLLFLSAYKNVWPEAKTYSSPIIDNVGDFFINTTYYTKGENDLSVNFGDANIKATGERIIKLLWSVGIQKDQYAWYINQVRNEESKYWKSAEGLILNPDLPKLKENYLPGGQKSHLYKDMGWATLRNSWEDNKSMLAVKSGFSWNHAHADAGSYILFHNGKNLIMDPGSASYLSPLYTEYYCQSEAHNVVFFNGEAQSRKDPYFGNVNAGSLHNLIEGKDFKYLLANATGPYSHILTRNYRSFIWVGDVILVIDDLLADEPGKFEWLLHYNGASNLKGGIDLKIQEDEAKIRVRPLFPETFPPGGERPHDFPESMVLTEKAGYEDHHPENRKPYWSISHFEKTARTKFVSAIILETEENESSLPVITRDQGKNYLKVSITQNGETTVVYFNLLADGRLKHRNSQINIEGWETDAYLTVLKFDENTDQSDLQNINEVFIGHGSYLRRNSQVVLHSLSKHYALVEDFGKQPKVIFDGQPNATVSLYNSQKVKKITLNGEPKTTNYDESKKLLKFQIRTH